VTGGVRGIGAAITQRLLNRGVTVAAGYSRDAAKAKDFQDQFDGMVGTLQGNVGSTGDCERVIDEVLQQHGRLDILVNSAGITADNM
jgi:acetoacetyl-CoA reductase